MCYEGRDHVAKACNTSPMTRRAGVPVKDLVTCGYPICSDGAYQQQYYADATTFEALFCTAHTAEVVA